MVLTSVGAQMESFLLSSFLGIVFAQKLGRTDKDKFGCTCIVHCAGSAHVYRCKCIASDKLLMCKFVNEGLRCGLWLAVEDCISVQCLTVCIKNQIRNGIDRTGQEYVSLTQ